MKKSKKKNESTKNNELPVVKSKSNVIINLKEKKDNDINAELPGYEKNEFIKKKLKSIFDQLKQGYFSEDSQFKEISMGMSGDYEIALKEGSSLIRVGSKLFGTR